MNRATPRAIALGCLALALLCGACAGPWGNGRVAIAAAPVTEDRYPTRTIAFPGGVLGQPDRIYATFPGYRPLTLDLYLPARRANAGRRRPLVLFLHGGAWQGGDARHAGAVENFPAWLAQLARRGYVVAAINYRLSGEAVFPAALMDAKIALRWLRRRGAELGIDRDRAIVWGVSAGGQIAALLTLACGAPEFDPVRLGVLAEADAEDLAEESDCVQGGVLWYSPSWFAPSPDRARDPNLSVPAARYLGCDPALCPPALLAQASPISFAHTRAPPLLLIHGRDDDVVPFSHSVALDARLREQGARSELLAIDHVRHSFVGASQAETRAATVLALNRTATFIAALAPAS